MYNRSDFARRDVFDMNWDLNPCNPANNRLSIEEKRRYMESKPDNQPLTEKQFRIVRNIERTLNVEMIGYSKRDAQIFISRYIEESMNKK